MSDFGDIEPEDSWHPDDPVPVLIDNLLRRCNLLDRTDELRDRDELVHLIGRRVRAYVMRRDSLSDRDKLRVDQLDEDFDHLITRAEH